MSETRQISQQVEPATNAARFMAKRGQVMMREFREFGKLRCEYGSKLTITTLIVSVAQGNAGERTYGVKLELSKTDSYDDSCLLDYDELKELLLAIKYLLQLAKETVNKTSDYTEFQYVSKDGFRVGYYQESDARQQAFIGVSSTSSIFVEVDQFKQLFELIKSAREHLIEKGAGSET